MVTSVWIDFRDTPTPMTRMSLIGSSDVVRVRMKNGVGGCMEGRRVQAQFATLARMCFPALTFVADGDGSEGSEGEAVVWTSN